MRKAILTITAFCFAIAMAFGQEQTEDVKLSDDEPSFEKTIEGLYVFSFKKGETDAQGNTPVNIVLENIAGDYIILLFDQEWDKNELRKYRYFLAKGYTGDFVHKMEGIKIDNNNHDVAIPSEDKYEFPEIIVKEGQPYECLVPIHVAKEKKMFLCSKKKKIIERVYDIPLKITVENTDPNYLLIEQQCDSLLDAFYEAIENHEFCTNKLHQPSFEKQIHPFKDEQDYLKTKINENKTKFEPGSSKYRKYKELLEELKNMDTAIEEYRESKYDCGDKTKHKTVHSCPYCKLSLEEIYNLLDRHYRNLRNREVEKKDIIKDVNMLYNCCKDPSCAKHAAQWRKGGLVKNKIIERYKLITDFQ